jgi:hypothetical protein
VICNISGVKNLTSHPVLDQIRIVDVVEVQVDSGSAARVVLATFLLVDVHKHQATKGSRHEAFIQR